jgi:hypothetical protein
MTLSRFIVQLAPFILWMFLWSLGALAAVVAFKLLVTGVGLGGLLSTSAAGQAEPERVVVLVTTVLSVALLWNESLSTLSSTTPQLAEPHDWMIWLAGGGQLSYLLGKSHRAN